MPWPLALGRERRFRDVFVGRKLESTHFSLTSVSILDRSITFSYFDSDTGFEVPR